MENSTKIIDFHLFGFKGLSIFWIIPFSLFLIVYILTLIVNVFIITLVSATHQLHSPMYFFLSHLSLCDLLTTCDIVPNTLYITWNEGGTMLFPACLSQCHFFGEATTTECLLLTVMSYDRYLAICKPLHYSNIMDLRLQYKMVILSWALGFITTFCIIIQLSQLQFCGSGNIDHYFCDFTPLFDLLCSDPYFVRIQANIFSSIFVLPPFFYIIVTYFYILFAILKISSETGRQKAFYTCSSHLSVVGLYYGSLIALYLASSRRNLFSIKKAVSIFYTIGTPLLNPITYSLRNREIRAAALKLLKKRNKSGAPI